MLTASVLRDYTLVWRGDPALNADADNFEEAWKRAVATRDWSALLRPGATPTVFRVRQLPGPLWRRLHDYLSNTSSGMGPMQFPALAFSMAVTAIDGYEGKVERTEHVDASGKPTGLGQVLSPETMISLDTIPDMVTELGFVILEARRDLHPL